MTSGRKPIAVICGAGPGIGAAMARRFAGAGYEIALLARRQTTLDELAQDVDGAHGFVCDLTDAASIESAFAAIRSELGHVDTLLYNAGSGVFESFENTTPEHFEQSWRVNAFGAFICVQQVAAAMKAAGSGNIIFTGATASRRGSPNTAAFAAAKAAQRSLAESLAKTLWPSGIHVAVIIVDGIVDSARARTSMPGRPDDSFVKPDAVAETAYRLCHQDRGAWSFEVEARPFSERW